MEQGIRVWYSNREISAVWDRVLQYGTEYYRYIHMTGSVFSIVWERKVHVWCWDVINYSVQSVRGD